MSASASERAVQSAGLTYEEYYRFAQPPFTLAPDPQFLFASPTHAAALREALAAVSGRAGVVAIIGEAGSGKTTVARALLGQLDQRTFASLVLSPFQSLETVLREVLLDFGLVSAEALASGPAASASTAELLEVLRGFVGSVTAVGGCAVLIIDEAQHAAPEALGALGALSDGGPNALQLVLLGEPALVDRLDLPELRHLRDRVARRARLEDLSREETEEYVWHRLKVARSSTAVYLGPDALDDLHAVTGGRPRQLNQVCDRALTLSALERAHEVTPEIVRRSARALGLLRTEVSRGNRRWSPWFTAVVAVPLALAGFLLFAPVSDWIRTPLPDLPGTPHPTTAPPAEARPVPSTLDAFPATEVPSLPRLASPPL